MASILQDLVMPCWYYCLCAKVMFMGWLTITCSLYQLKLNLSCPLFTNIFFFIISKLYGNKEIYTQFMNSSVPKSRLVTFIKL